MFALTITEPDGAYYTRLFEKTEITIGRGVDNDLVLPDGNVSTRHAKISYRDGKFVMVDNHSTNGVYVNGVMATKPVVVVGPNTIHIAIYAISISPVLPAPTEHSKRRYPSSTNVQSIEDEPTRDAKDARDLISVGPKSK
jgi:pSer/pThr/pTyr-binding forkhead associated (FHA) protein